ncbi:hypothetical protein [Eubacterium xylanophilum]|uniref:hypothetical protein n=1 Tax=Eubacterium xylanophilum TaxID=39497 RepID=UPI00047B1261|nr:hypothetical protein [Eubacterium xylanophilum]
MIKMTVNRIIKRILVYVIPVVVVYSIIAFLKSVYDIHEFSDEEKLSNISSFFQTVMPIVLTWWVLIINKNIIHDDGNELYRIYISGSSSALSHLVLQGCFFPMIVIGYCIINILIIHINPSIIFYVALESFCLSSLAFMLNYILSNVGIGLIVVGLYAFCINVVDSFGLFKKISIYTDGDEFNAKNGVIMAVIGLVFLLVGGIKYNVRPNYN